ncbi:hypothetical protein SDRG_05062 [Saprolegnia diclina VS20]|uniref:Uncharacterized protein n=1 Tax=Saprolegnia diclina (strain VS20) TaxID=1156394 RepID=T0QHQ3_SAPDV|nr:hypothetical protein SDRG_05062 [Saprolegnia diclina VS20]EQC37459.1 hypothetical protein SDRG_05062 [Saprolegnia diclina VS20]|eukprot:XP_008608979.1 hypothetical protein SDRG_05062 [Saprolegnia diclina VS20]
MWATIEPLHDTIMGYAGLLTQYLAGRLGDATLEPATKRGIWEDALRSEWPGDWAQLPRVQLDKSSFRCVQSRATYDRLCRFLGDAAFPTGTTHDRSFYYVTFYDASRPAVDSEGRIVTEGLIVPEILVAPMTHVWLDVLAPMLRCPVALAHAAVCGGHASLLRHLLENVLEPERMSEVFFMDRPLRGHAMDLAAGAGHLEVLQVLHAAGGTCSTTAMDSAACGGHFDVVDWLHKHRSEGCTSAALDLIARTGRVDMVEFLMAAYNVSFSIRTVDAAAANGDLHTVQLLHERFNAGCTRQAMNSAAAGGHLATLAYLQAHFTAGCTVDAMDAAIMANNLHIVRFLHTHRTEGYSPIAFDVAARNNYMEMVRYLSDHRHEGGTHRALDRAAGFGHLNMVRFLCMHRDEGCTTLAMDVAAKRGHLDVLMYLYEHRTEGFTHWGIFWAAQESQDQTLQFLLLVDADHERARSAVACAVANRDAAVLQRLRDAGCAGADVAAIPDVQGADACMGEKADANNMAENDARREAEDGLYDECHYIDWLSCYTELCMWEHDDRGHAMLLDASDDS